MTCQICEEFVPGRNYLFNVMDNQRCKKCLGTILPPDKPIEVTYIRLENGHHVFYLTYDSFIVCPHCGEIHEKLWKRCGEPL